MGNFFKVMGVVTVMALLYIHLQMNIYALAYQGKKKELRIEKLAEHNAIVKNDVLRLKSSDHIGRQLLDKEKSYQFASRSHVMEVESRQDQGLIGRVMTLAFSGH